MSMICADDMVCSQAHIQNATLAGGVAVGTACSMMMSPWGALLVGSIAGLISTFGFAYVSVRLVTDKPNILSTVFHCNVVSVGS